MNISIFTFGCKVNQYESQILREGFENSGYTLKEDFRDSEMILINSCAVTKNAERDVYKLSKKVIKENKKLVIVGCFTDELKEKIKNISSNVSFFSNIEKNKILQNIPTKITYFHNHTRAFLKIQDGCNSFCSYCIIPYLRPSIYSRNPEDIIKEIENFISKGCPEIVLSGIRLGKYNSNGTTLTELLQKILSLKAEVKIRLSSIELNDITPSLIDLIKDSQKIVRHLHIPLQSGDNRILKLMKRPYTAEEFSQKYNFISEKIPDIVFTTDVMVGFPTEDEINFENTLNFIKKHLFKKIHVFPYSPRPLTEATKIGYLISPQKIKERTKILLRYN